MQYYKFINDTTIILNIEIVWLENILLTEIEKFHWE